MSAPAPGLRRAAALAPLWLLLLALRAAAAPQRAAEREQAAGRDAALLQAAEREQAAGHYDAALRLAERALAQAEVAAARVPALLRAGDLLLQLARYDRAAASLEAAAQGAAAARRGDWQALAADRLGELAYMRGRYGEAERRYGEALRLGEAALGADHPQVAATLQGLGTLAWRRRRYEEAEALLQRGLAIRRRRLGEDHPDVASSLNGLALVYRMRGELPRALELYERALGIRERRLGPAHPDVAAVLGNLAEYHVQQGDLARAEAEHQRALAIREAALGPAHYLTGSSLNNLAHLYNVRGDFARAEPLFRRAIAIYEGTVGPAHSSTGTLWNNLAELLRNRGDLAAAEEAARRSLQIRRAALGPEHPNVADSLHSLGLVLGLRGATVEAAALLTEALDVYERHLRREGLGLSDKGLAAFLQALRGREEAIYALLERRPADAALRRCALAATLSRKGRSAEETTRTFQAIRRSLGDAADRERLDRLRALREQAASAELQGQDRGAAARLAREIDDLEGALAQRSRALRTLRALPPPSALPERVARALPPDGALIEYVAYQAEAPRSISLLRSAAERRYAALVLLPDGRSAAAPLGAAAEVEPAAAALLAALSRPPVPGAKDPAVAPARALHRLLLAPLGPLLAGRRLLLSTEGALHQVPFAALHDGQDYLIARHALSYLPGGQALLRAAPAAPAAVGDIVVFADPDFSGLPQALPPLSGTRREAAAIQRLAPAAQLLLGRDASRPRLLALRAPAILHVATHGLYLGDDGPGSDGGRGMKVSADGASASPPAPPPRAASGLSPLVRSQLVLAAAPPGPGSDGRGAVTALEVAGMDLSGTQLVVLSACDTGKGEQRPGQGVYGLQRAFLLAGAETVVVSLWRISDDATAELMGAYYRRLLAGAGRAAALQAAAAEMRRRRPAPYFWAPFIAVGDDGPLSGLGETGQLKARDAVVRNLGSLLDPQETGLLIPE